MRKKDDTLRDTLLNLSREIADTEGIEAVNIRSMQEEPVWPQGRCTIIFPIRMRFFLH